MTYRGWITAREAIRALGVKPATLYSYASRGMVRTLHGGGRTKLYSADDVARLCARRDAARGHAAAAAGALRWGPPVLDSAITEIRLDGPYYRGRNAIALAQRETRFDEVAWWLWTGLPGTLPKAAPDAAELAQLARHVEAGMPPWLRLAAALPWLVRVEGPPGGPADERRAGAWLLRTLVGALSLPDVERAASAAAAPTLAAGLALAIGAVDGATRWINRALVLCADHELNASAFTARVAASADASLHAAVGAALYTLSGDRHGGGTRHAEAFVAGQVSTVDAGFGHPLYPQGDPRAPPLLEALPADHPVHRSLTRAEARGRRPNVDLGLAAVAQRAGAPGGTAAALFAIGRCAGWIAHILEQRTRSDLLRPRARYIGPKPTGR